MFRIKFSALISSVTLGFVLVGGGAAFADDAPVVTPMGGGGMGCCRTVE